MNTTIGAHDALADNLQAARDDLHEVQAKLESHTTFYEDLCSELCMHLGGKRLRGGDGTIAYDVLRDLAPAAV